MAKNQISSFTSDGRSVSGVGRSRIPLANPGVRQADGNVYKPSRKEITGGISGKSVTVTNPKASAASLAQRTASLGMGGVGSRGRNQDFA